MNFENIKSDGLELEYKVVFPAEEIESEIQKNVEKKAKTFKMQGFRPGHVPLDIVRRNVESSIMEDVFDSLILNACKAIVKDAKLSDLAAKPAYKFENQYEKGKDLNLTIYIEAAPSFEILPYEMEITKIVPNVSDDEVKDAIKSFMDSSPVFEKAESGYQIKPRDEVSYKAICYNNGVESKKKSFSDHVVIPANIPEGAEFLQNFIGKKVGESFEFVPATDKKLTYKMVVESIRKALTDISVEEFAKRKKFKDAQDLEAEMKKGLEAGLSNQAFIYHKNQVLEQLGEKYNFELPERILEQEMHSVLNSVKKEAEELAVKEGKKQDIKSDEELRKEYSDIVRKRVLLGYVLNKIAKKEKITVDDKEVRQAVLADLRGNPDHAREILEYYSKNPDAFAYKKAEIIEAKVILFLLSKAKTTEVQKTRKEIEEIVIKLLEDE